MDRSNRSDARRIVVIGPCASGKTTLARRLQSLGYDARVSGQEHSQIANLWKRLEPDVLIALRVDLNTLRQRRSAGWPENLYRTQLERLRDGFAHADLLIDADRHDEDAVLEIVTDWLGRHRSPT